VSFLFQLGRFKGSTARACAISRPGQPQRRARPRRNELGDVDDPTEKGTGRGSRRFCAQLGTMISRRSAPRPAHRSGEFGDSVGAADADPGGLDDGGRPPVAAENAAIALGKPRPRRWLRTRWCDWR